MKFSLLTFATVFVALAAAAPAPEGAVLERAQLEARGCSCTKIADEWICRGTTCQ
ncbi:hypothetical protein EsH8_X_000385 [Colletotrichum jinshuiense]